jgi:hypothetical protein
MTPRNNKGDRSSLQPSLQLRIRRDLIRNNLDTCFVYAELAKHEVESGMRGRAEHAFGCAQCSYEAILRFLNTIDNREHRSEIENKLSQLSQGLDFLRRELNRPPAALKRAQ